MLCSHTLIYTTRLQRLILSKKRVAKNDVCQRLFCCSNSQLAVIAVFFYKSCYCCLLDACLLTAVEASRDSGISDFLAGVTTHHPAIDPHHKVLRLRLVGL
jgi:hypothetical protein